MPMAYGDRSALTRAVRRHYLEPFRTPDDRVLVLHRLARSLIESRGYLADLWRRADTLRSVPTLLVWGMRDPAFGPAFLDRWRARLPHARVATLDRAGHWPHEESPETVAASLEEFRHA